MQFLVVLLRILLERLMPDGRDGLALAARSDGHLEQLPIWTQWIERCRRWMLASTWRREATGRRGATGRGGRRGEAARRPVRKSE